MDKSKKRPPEEPSNGVHDGPRITLPIPEQEASSIKGRRLSEVQRRDGEWLLFPWIPLGTITLLVGPPNVGKSTFVASLMAWVTSDGRMDGKEIAQRGNVVLLPGFEEDVEVTTSARMDAAGVDGRRVLLLEEEYRLHTDRKRIARAVKEFKARLVLIDPIDSYVEDETKGSQGHHIRITLEAAVWIGKQTGAAVAAVRHPGKDPRNFMVGHRQWTAVPRSIVEFNRDSGRPPKYTISLWRDGLGTNARSREYTLPGPDGKPKKFVLTRTLDTSEEELHRVEGGPVGKWKLMQACRLIKWLFDSDPEPLRYKLGEEAKAQGIGPDTVNDAMRMLGIQSVNGAGRDDPWKMVRTVKEWPTWLTDAPPAGGVQSSP